LVWKTKLVKVNTGKYREDSDGEKIGNMFTRFDRIHERHRQTDRQMDTARQHSLRLCTASSGKNWMGYYCLS